MTGKKTKRKSMVDAYWFAKYEKDGLVYSGYGDEPGWRDGEERTVARPEDVSMCTWGYHAADSWFHALQHAQGPIACRVRLQVTERDSDGKLVGPRRLLVAHVDARPELRLAAAEFAEDALLRDRAAGREPHPRSWDAIKAARRYARGEIGPRALRAAYAAAYGADASAYAAAYAAYPDWNVPYALHYAFIYAAAAGAGANGAYSPAYAIKRQAKRLDYWMEQAFARKGEGAGG